MMIRMTEDHPDSSIVKRLLTKQCFRQLTPLSSLWFESNPLTVNLSVRLVFLFRLFSLVVVTIVDNKYKDLFLY